MRAIPLLLALGVFTTLPLTSEAQRRYKVYKTNEFGRKDFTSQPEAIIEEDSLTGDLKVYESNSFGLPDTIKGPSYIIDNDSLFGPRPHRWDPDEAGLEALHDHHDHDDPDCAQHEEVDAPG